MLWSFNMLNLKSVWWLCGHMDLIFQFCDYHNIQFCCCNIDYIATKNICRCSRANENGDRNIKIRITTIFFFDINGAQQFISDLLSNYGDNTFKTDRQMILIDEFQIFILIQKYAPIVAPVSHMYKWYLTLQVEQLGFVERIRPELRCFDCFHKIFIIVVQFEL